VILTAKFSSQSVPRFGNLLAYRISRQIGLPQNVEARSKKHLQSSIHVSPFAISYEDYCAAPNVAIRYIPHYLLNMFLNRAALREILFPFIEWGVATAPSCHALCYIGYCTEKDDGQS
jgi:hypothetical protein